MLKKIKKIYPWSKKVWPFKYLLYPSLTAVFLTGPTCYVSYASKIDPSLLPSNKMVIILFYAWPAIVLVGHKVYNEIGKNILSVKYEELMRLFVVIDSVVGSKSHRFAEFVTKYNGNEPIDVFREITKPELQIEKLVEAVYKFFEVGKPNPSISFRVALAKMNDKYIDKFYFFQPEDKPPRGKLAEYQKECCGFTKAKKKKDIILIEDIAKDVKKIGKKGSFAEVEGGSQSGSMIVYPIRHHGLKDVVFCLSVWCSEPNYFKDSQIGGYREIMAKFANRIELEYSLMLIKEKRNGNIASA